MSGPPPLDDTRQAVIITLCTNLLMQYANAIDSGDLAGFAALFTPDGVFERPGVEPLVGRRAIEDYLIGLFSARRAGNPQGHLQRHLFTTVWIDPVSETEAWGISCAIAYRDARFGGTLPSATRLPELIVEYRDEFRREDAGWRLHRHVSRHLFSEHVAGQAFAAS